MEHVWTGYCGSDAHWISCVCNDTEMTGSLVGVVYYVNLPMSSTSASAQCLLSPETRAEVTRASTVSSQPLLYSKVQYSTVQCGLLLTVHCTGYWRPQFAPSLATDNTGHRSQITVNHGQHVNYCRVKM